MGDIEKISRKMNVSSISFFRFLLFLIFCFSSLNAREVQQRVIYVFGDSHATPFFLIPGTKEVVGSSHTMHHVAKYGFSLSGLPFKKGDVLLFSFGQIDVGWHMCKQKYRHHREMEEIIETLSTQYVGSLHSMTQPYEGVIPVVYSILPPSDESGLSIPYEGSIEERALITRALNERIKVLCLENRIEFVDVYDIFADSNGVLRKEVRDNVSFFHLDPAFYPIVCEKLNDILSKYP